MNSTKEATITASSDGLYIEELDITLTQLDKTTAETLGIRPFYFRNSG